VKLNDLVRSFSDYMVILDGEDCEDAFLCCNAMDELFDLDQNEGSKIDFQLTKKSVNRNSLRVVFRRFDTIDWSVRSDEPKNNEIADDLYSHELMDVTKPLLNTFFHCGEGEISLTKTFTAYVTIWEDIK